VSRLSLELADIFRRYGPAFRQTYAPSLAQQRVMTAIESCRTAALGGHVDQCDACGHQRISYNSCRNRHCPKCQGQARAQWLAAREAELLPVPYFHVVFTIPDPLLAPLALQNKRVLYDILFRATARTLLTIGKDPKHLGAAIGFFAVLHTWGRNLLHHPHLHCAVPAGGVSPDRQRWIACKKGFLLPVRVLSALFRRLFLEGLQAAFAKGKLSFHGSLSDLADPAAFAKLIQDAGRKKWVVYSKPPFGGPECVLRYLARYTNRVALSNDRLLDIENGKITFSWKDYKDHHRQKAMTLDANEFIRRFLLHVVPDGFVRIRHFGLLANRHRQENLALCRRLLGASQNPVAISSAASPPPAPDPETDPSPDSLCPECRQGHMRQIQILPPISIPMIPPSQHTLHPLDSS
jgi:hypothetical protein